MNYQKGDFEISTDRDRLQIGIIHSFLKESYWCKGIPLEVLKKAIENACCFGLYHFEQQVGFARVVTDYATFAYLADVFVLEDFRGKGLSKWLVQVIKEYPDLQGLRRWVLGTRDAHRLYEKYGGFTPLKEPGRFMECHFPKVYQN